MFQEARAGDCRGDTCGASVRLLCSGRAPPEQAMMYAAHGGACRLVPGTKLPVELTVVTGAAADALHTRAVQRIALSYRLVISDLVAVWCSVPLGRVDELTAVHGGCSMIAGSWYPLPLRQRKENMLVAYTASTSSSSSYV